MFVVGSFVRDCVLQVFCCDYTESGRILFCGESIDEADGVDIPPRPTGKPALCFSRSVCPEHQGMWVRHFLFFVSDYDVHRTATSHVLKG